MKFKLVKHFRPDHLSMRVPIMAFTYPDNRVLSLIPSSTRLMALTATASIRTRQEVIKVLGMLNPAVNAMSPHKCNIVYWVGERKSIEECFGTVVKQLKLHRCDLPRMMIFCFKYNDCSMLYKFFKESLGDHFTEPIGAPDHSRLRLVDMYTSLTHSAVKQDIQNNFSVPNSPLRVLICTIAYGMGVDCSNARQIIHWGPSDSIEAYIQESGRAGRDNNQACALLLVKKDVLKKFLHADIVTYCTNNTICRRSLLLLHLIGHLV